MKKRCGCIFFVFILFFAFQPEVVAQCAMCKASVESSLKNDPNSLGRSLNSGILYLMAVPYLMIAFIFRKQLVQLWKRAFRKEIAGTEKQ